MALLVVTHQRVSDRGVNCSMVEMKVWWELDTIILQALLRMRNSYSVRSGLSGTQ